MAAVKLLNLIAITALALIATLTTVSAQTDISTAGPFLLVTTNSLTVPVVPTAFLLLSYINIDDDRNGPLLLDPVAPDQAVAERFALNNGVLNTWMRPDDTVCLSASLAVVSLTAPG